MSRSRSVRSFLNVVLVLAAATARLAATPVSQQSAGGNVQWAGGNLKQRTQVPRPPVDSLFPATLFKVGPSPRYAAIGDLDGDLDQDVVTANFGNGTFSKLMNFGNGTFADAISTSIGSVNSQPRAIVLGDLDGDLDLDVVIACFLTNNFKVLLNDGDGTFGPFASYAMGTNPTSIQVGDLDGDTDLDVATANFTSNNFSVRKNAGNGTFGAVVHYAAGTGPNGVAFADVDGDTDLDVCVANTNTSSVTIHPNNGDGTFAALVSYATSTPSPSSIAAADLDGDTDQDVVVATFGGGHCACVFKNNGDGTFAAVTSVGPTSGGAGFGRHVTIGDLDGDLDLDLAVVKSRDDGDFGSLSILVNAGDGTFGAAVEPLAGQDPRCVAAGDLNGDAELDLVLVHHLPGMISVLPNDGEGTILGALPSPVIAGELTWNTITVTDLDGDGDKDVATAGAADSGQPNPNRMWVFKNNASGVLSAPTQTLLGSLGVGGLEHGDLNGDLDQDLVGHHYGADTLLVLSNSGTGTFGAPAALPVGNGPSGSCVVDLDGDLDLDVVMSNYDGMDVTVLLNDGTGAFPSSANYGPGGGDPDDRPRHIAVADFDGDNDVDLVVSAGFLNVLVYLNNGNGTFATESAYDAQNYAWSTTTADFDLDGDVDIAVMTTDNLLSVIAVLSNNGDGTFVNQPIASRQDLSRQISAADLDGDLLPELVVGTTTGILAVYRNAGGLAFAAPKEHQIGFGTAHRVEIADLDADGDLDLVGTSNFGESSHKPVVWTLQNQRFH